MAFDPTKFSFHKHYDDNARRVGVELKGYQEVNEDGTRTVLYKIVDPKRRVVINIKDMSEYREYCLKYYA